MSEDAHETPAPSVSYAPPATEPPICEICNRYTAPFGGHEGEEVCSPTTNCQRVQPYGLSSYPGEFKLVRAHPTNYGKDEEGEQWYKRADIDPLLIELRRLQGATLVFGIPDSHISKAEDGADDAGILRYISDPDYPTPGAEDLSSPLFEAIWRAIKGWDLSRYGSGGPGMTLYAGATGSDVMHILAAIAPFAAVVSAAMTLRNSGYDGPMMGEEVSPLYLALALAERTGMTPESLAALQGFLRRPASVAGETLNYMIGWGRGAQGGEQPAENAMEYLKLGFRHGYEARRHAEKLARWAIEDRLKEPARAA